MDEYKTCTKCSQTKLLNNFSKHNGKKSNKSGYRASCKSCELAYQRSYAAKNRAKAQKNSKSWKIKNPDAWANIQARSYQKNKSKRQSYMAQYRQDNPQKIRTYVSKRRAQILNNFTWTVTEKDLSRMLNKVCSYCQISPAVHIDHIIPLSKGGNHSIGNLTGACRSCNLSKGSMFVMEWRRRRENGHQPTRKRNARTGAAHRRGRVTRRNFFA